MLDNDEVVKCLNNCEAWLSRCIGYCHNHKAYVTVKQAKGRQCDGKHCKYLEKIQNDYWSERSECKNLRKKRKETLKELIEAYKNSGVKK